MQEKVLIEVDIEDTVYDEMVRIADERNITVDALFEKLIEQGLERDTEC